MKVHKLNIDGKTVFVSQRDDIFRVIKPWKNEDGSVNWFNLLTGGSWLNVIITAVIVVVVLGTLYEYTTNMQTLLDCFEIPGRLQACIEAFGSGPQIILP